MMESMLIIFDTSYTLAVLPISRNVLSATASFRDNTGTSYQCHTSHRLHPSRRTKLPTTKRNKKTRRAGHYPKARWEE